MPERISILLAGGGTGGHIFPNLAVVERLRELGVDFEPYFLVSKRFLDGQILRQLELTGLGLPVRPLSAKPWKWPGFILAWRGSMSLLERSLRQRRVGAVVATGGFVSGPVMVLAHRRRIPAALVNLDAVPGKANRALVGRASAVFSAYPHPALGQARTIGVPLLRRALWTQSAEEARRQLGLDPLRPTLLVTGGSLGASSLNQAMTALAQSPTFAAALRPGDPTGWQVLHQTGDKDTQAVQAAYAQAGVPARVEPFCDRMGLAWGAASLAVARAGASTASEAWANAVPTVFLPYPYHKDQHQRLNAQPLVDAGGALLARDLVQPQANVEQLTPLVAPLLGDAGRRAAMVEKLRATRPADGAAVVAAWVKERLDEQRRPRP